jgi:hypothetical protein
MIPDSTQHNSDPYYLDDIVKKIVASKRYGNTQSVATRIGISARTLRSYCDPGDQRQCPYPVQFALESLLDSLNAK